MKKKIKKKYIILLGIFLVLLAIGVFFQFTAVGYRLTVPYRNFDKLTNNVYIDQTFSGDKNEVERIVDEAMSRVSDFWGTLESSPVIIISDNEKTLKKLGGDHDTTVIVFFGAHCYISVSGEYLNVDIVAHEITHAELYERLYKGKILPQTLIPTWFDEGVATQNDYREQYSEQIWKEKTNFGENVIALDEMDTYAKFYAGDVEDRRLRYLISRHEVKVWIEQNGMNALLNLIEQVNQGGDFYELYNVQ